MTAEQIVEAEIGSQDDIEQFVGGALKPDFILARLAMDKPDYIYPAVYDTQTGNIVAYMRSQYAGEDKLWNTSLGDTVRHWRHMLNDEYSRFTPMEVEMVDRTHFPDWRRAIAWLLQFPQAQEAIGKIMGIQECAKGIPALRYMEKLDRLTQALAARDYFPEKIDRRVGKGTSCYVLGPCIATTAEEACKIVEAAGAVCGLRITDAKAARPNERNWQVDFNVVNLFENDDIEGFVTTAFREQVPGHAELERAAKFRDALRAVGIPVYRVEVHDPRTTGSIETYHDGRLILQQKTGLAKTEFTFYWDNRQTHLSKGKSVALAQAAVEKIGSTCEFPPQAVHGRGQMRYIRLFMPSVGVPGHPKMPIYAESEDYDSFGEIAAARSGTIADELRLKRLVDYLKQSGLKVKEASLDQQGIMVRGDFGINVIYTLYGIYSPRISLDPGIAKEQVKRLALTYLNATDREISGADKVSDSDFKMSGRPESARGIVMRLVCKSLRRPDDQDEVPLARTKMTVEAEGDFEEYGDVATEGMRSRIWLRNFRRWLNNKGVDVRELRLSYPQGHNAMRLLIYANKVAKDQYEPDYKTFTSQELMQHFYDGIKATGNKRVTNNPMYPPPTIRGDTTNEQFSHVFLARFYVESPEPNAHWSGDIFENEFDDMGIGEHERLQGIVQAVEDSSQTVHIIWARAEASPDYPGSTCVRIRTSSRHVEDATLAVVQGFKKMGIETVRTDRGTGVHVLDYKPILGRWLTDVVAYLPADQPLANPITLPGRATGHQYYDNMDRPLNVDETFDPEDETWLRRVVDRWPGVADLARLKDAIREIEKTGLEIVGANQDRKNHDAHDTVAGVMISVRIGANSQHRWGTPGILADMKKITDALTPWHILDLSHEYDTLDKELRVFVWFWHSHNAPEDIVPLNLRKGSWDEYCHAGHNIRERDMFLVEQFNEPGEEHDDPYGIEQFTSDVVDPLWREKLRLRAIADDIKAAGWHGNLHLQGKETNLNSPTIWFNLWSENTPEKEYQGDTDDKYQVRNLLQNLNRKHEFTAPGRMWSNLHDLRSKIVGKNPSRNDLGHRYGWVVSFPYMWRHPESPQLIKDTPIQKSQVHVHVDEALEWTPQELAGFGAVAAVPNRRTVVQNAFKAMQEKFKELFPGVPAFANFLQAPSNQTGSTRFEMTIHADLPPATYEGLKSWQQRDHMCQHIRNAVLASGLKRYKPKRVVYYKWPVTDIYFERETHIIVIVKFNLKGMEPEDRHVNVPNIYEAVDIDPEGFVHGALPDLEDRSRIKAMLDQWASLSNYVVGGAAWANPNYNPIRAGQRRGPYRHRADIYIQAVGKVDSIEACENQKTWVLQEILELLANHGFGTFTMDKYAIGNHTIKIENLYVRSANRNGWKITIIGADVKTKGLITGNISWGNTGLEESAFDPAEFMAGADKASQYGAYVTLGHIAEVLRSKGWVGYLHARAWKGSSTMHELTIRMGNKGPGMAVIREWEEVVKKDVEEAIQGLFTNDDVMPHFDRKQVIGYENEYPGYYHWMVNIVLDLRGRAPMDVAGTDNYVLFGDIETGAISLERQPVARLGNVNID